MTLDLTHRAFQPQLEEDILDVLGYATPSFLLSYLQITEDVVVLLSDAGEVLYANARALDRFFDRDLEQVRGALWLHFLPEPTRATIDHALALAGNGQQVHCQVAQDAASGTPEMQLSLSPIYLRDGTLECLLAVVRLAPANTNAEPAESG